MGCHIEGWKYAFSPDGLQLASGGFRVWSTDNAELQLDIDAHIVYLGSVVHVWSPDGQELVSASDVETIKFWDSSNGTQIGQPSSIKSLSIYSDGSFIATASHDKTVHLWSTKSQSR